MHRYGPRGLRRLTASIGLSRHSALPELGRQLGPSSRCFAVRSAALAAGSTLIGTAVALLVQADLGLPPYDVLSSGIAERIGLSLGQAGWLVAAILFTVAASFGRRPSVWGVAYIVGNGLAIDGVANLLNQPGSALGRLLFLVFGVITMAGGVNLVLYSGTTGGPFELLMLAGEDRGINRTATRYFLDLGVLIGGIAIGGAFGIGTLVYAALMGVALQKVSEVFADHRAGRQQRIEARRSSTSDRLDPAGAVADPVPTAGPAEPPLARSGPLS